MKIIVLLTLLFAFSTAQAQDEVLAKLDEAKAAYGSDNLEETRFALQQSLAALDVLVGKEILALLPEQIKEMDYIADGDDVAGSSAAFTGVFVHRGYTDGEDHMVDIEIATNSPLLSSLSTFLTNPLFASAAGGNQKVIKIDSYKSVLQKDEDDPLSYDIQIPFDETLMTVSVQGYDEDDAIEIAESLHVRDIAGLLR